MSMSALSFVGTIWGSSNNAVVIRLLSPETPASILWTELIYEEKRGGQRKRDASHVAQAFDTAVMRDLPHRSGAVRYVMQALDAEDTVVATDSVSAMGLGGPDRKGEEITAKDIMNAAGEILKRSKELVNEVGGFLASARTHSDNVCDRYARLIDLQQTSVDRAMDSLLDARAQTSVMFDNSLAMKIRASGEGVGAKGDAPEVTLQKIQAIGALMSPMVEVGKSALNAYVASKTGTYVPPPGTENSHVRAFSPAIRGLVAALGDLVTEDIHALLQAYIDEDRDLAALKAMLLSLPEAKRARIYPAMMAVMGELEQAKQKAAASSNGTKKEEPCPSAGDAQP